MTKSSFNIYPFFSSTTPTLRCLSALLLIVMSLTNNTLWAAPEPVYSKVLTDANMAVNNFLLVTDPKYIAQKSAIVSTQSVDNTVVFEINEAKGLTLPDKFVYSLYLKVEGKDINNNPLPILYPTMVLDYDGTPTSRTALRQVYSFKGYHEVKVTVTKTTYKVNGITYTNDLTLVPLAFNLYANIKIERVMLFNCLDKVTSASHLDITGQADRKLLSWSNVTNANEYDVEWTFYDEQSEVGVQLTARRSPYLQPDFDYLFKNNATRITTTLQQYSITLIYPRGYLFYRIRAAHYDANGQREVTDWTSIVPSACDITAFPHKFLINGQDPYWNWQTQQVFAEEGKQTQSLKYFDASLRERQTQALSNAAKTVVAGETIYDHQGRPVLKVMPAPMPNMSLGYVEGLSKNKAAEPKDYSRADFIKTTNSAAECAGVPDGMNPSLSKGAANYFSPNNPLVNSVEKQNQFTPDAEEFPFSVTEFMPDATGRIRRQSGVGKDFKLGSGHETKYFYAKPSQEELDRLFGLDVGDNTAYLKNMVIDGNGQGSVSYIDAHGRTIATALAGETTENLNKLDNQPATADMLTKDLLNNIVQGNALVSSYTLPVHTEGVHNIQYLLNGDKLRFEDICKSNGATPKNICFTCVYDLSIKITSDDCNFVPVDFKLEKFNLRTTCDLVNLDWKLLDWKNNNVALPRGTYQITKRLTVSQSAIEKNWDTYRADAVCVSTRASFIKAATDTLSFFQCKDTTLVNECQKCRDENITLGTFRGKYSLKYPQLTESYSAAYETQVQQAYDNAVSRCRLNCSDECSILFQNLLSDVAPSGQYGVVYDETTRSYTPKTGASVYRDNNFQLARFIYLNEDGALDFVLINGVSKTPNQLSLTEFVTNWKPLWAHTLVQDHPEYPYFQWCSSPTRDSWFVFEDTLRQQDYYRIYTQLPVGTLKNLPLVTDPINSTLTSAQRALIYNTSVINTNVSPATPITIFQVAKSSVYCNDPTSSTCSITDALAGKTGCAAQDSLFWVTLRTLYLANRRQVMYTIRENEIDAASKAKVKSIGSCRQTNQDLATNPLVECTDCSANPLYGCKIRRTFLQGDIPTFPSLINTVNEKANTQQNLDLGYAENCKGLAEAWVAQLNCLSPTDDQKAELQKYFIKICQAGSDLDHPNGATSTDGKRKVYYNDDPRSTEFSSLEAVMLYFFPRASVCTDCYTSLIQSPSYDNQYNAARQIDKLTAADVAICTKYSALKTIYNRDIALHGFTKFLDFFNSLSVVRLNQIELDRIGSLCATNVSCNVVGGVLTIPPQLDGSRCKTCDELTALVNTYNSFCGFPTTSTLDEANAQMNRLTRWLNSQTGMNLDVNEYTWFFNQCRNQTATSSTFKFIKPQLDAIAAAYSNAQNVEVKRPPYMLCSRPLTLEEEFIDSSCFNAVKQQAINNANLRYDAYMDSLKNDFFTRYTLNCLQKAQQNEVFTDLGPTKEYHYTLYYYDQAGNLVQTVPPTGVKLLTAKEIKEVGVIRKSTITKGLVAYYPFDKDIKDYSPSGLDLFSNPAEAAFSPVIPNGDGLHLTPTSSYRTQETDILNNDQHAIAFFIKFPERSAADDWAKIFGYCPSGTNRSPGIFQYPGAAPQLHWRYGSAADGGLTATSEGNIFNTQEWYHVTCIKNKNVLSYYINGIKFSDQPVVDPKAAGTSPLYFGVFGGQVSSKAALKDFKIFNRLLTDEEVYSLSQAKPKLAPTGTGLVAHYPFQNDLKDYAGRGLDLTPSSGAPGIITGEGLKLNAASFYTSAITDVLNNDKHTISFYIKFPTTNPNPSEWAKIFGYQVPNVSDRTPGIWLYPATTQRMYWTYDPNNLSVSSNNFNINQWYHITGVKKGNILSYYLDGTKFADVTVPAIKSPGLAPLRLGKDGGYPGATAYIKDFRIYDRSLTDDEVIALMPQNTRGLVAHYPFDKDVKDYSGSGLDLAPNPNSPAFEPIIPNGDGLKLTTTTSYASPSTPILNNDQHTIAFFVKFPSNSPTNWVKIFGYCPSGTDRSPGIFQYPGNVTQIHWRYGMDANGGLSGTSESRPFNKEEWYHVAGVKNGGILSYYINGVKIAADPVTNPKIAGNSPLFFGVFEGQTSSTVSLKDFRIYNRPLNDAEVAALIPTNVKPEQLLTTRYWYNALNQVTMQVSPDGGTSLFWYDFLGRLVLSQNEKQFSETIAGKTSKYSYTLFDRLGRTTEVGQGTWFSNKIPFPSATSDRETYYYNVDGFVKSLRPPVPPAVSPFEDATAFVKEQVTRTHYDAPPQYVGSISGFSQQNLRNRVAVVTYANIYTTANSFDFATHYSYDVAGNVKTLIHNIPELAAETYATGNIIAPTPKTHRYKRLDYNYDLVSGKVNKLYYQQGEPDQFVYRYDYDEDNRLKQALSSTDDMIWNLEATYKYYKHGPLSRIELGREFRKVQGMDYAYTLQGWIKGVNASFLDPNKDMGKDIGDGSAGSAVRKDAFGYSIGYFDGDYKPIGTTATTDVGFAINTSGTPAASAYARKGLYNGNIRYIASANEKFTDPLLMTYDYDQLNRLTKMESWNSAALNKTTRTWTLDIAATKWREDITYDPNGNINNYKRNDENGLLIDNINYNYLSNTNKLASVADNAPLSAYPDDIEGATGNTFVYDKIGNLITDNKENTSFLWNVYGKMQSATKAGIATTFGYDPQQNRFKKATPSGSDFYIRDAQGNVLAIYQKKDATFVWKEQHLYGSSRLGIFKPEINIRGTYVLDVANLPQGARSYELTNHLGNVLATITDKGVITSASDYYPFGLTLASRSFTEGGSAYRFGFNGKENDKELKQQDYKNRINRPDLGRFLSVDPLSKKYPMLTPYQFASNVPTLGIDLDGLELYINTTYPNGTNVINNFTYPVRHIDIFTLSQNNGPILNMGLSDNNGPVNSLVRSYTLAQSPNIPANNVIGNITNTINKTNLDVDETATLTYGTRFSNPTGSNSATTRLTYAPTSLQSADRSAGYSATITRTSADIQKLGRVTTLTRGLTPAQEILRLSNLLLASLTASMPTAVVYNVNVFFCNQQAQNANYNNVLTTLRTQFPNATINPVINPAALNQGLNTGANAANRRYDATGTLRNGVALQLDTVTPGQ